MTRKMPKQKPGRSKQDYQTPREFILALQRRFGRITFDLAADKKTAVCRRYFSEQQDSLKQKWPRKGILYLNPRYRWLRPWMIKCAEHTDVMEPESKLLVLVPASIGTVWFERSVLSYADIEGLRPRITFVGEENPYPKDLMLLIYSAYQPEGYLNVWKWK